MAERSDAAEVRSEVRDWLDANWDPERSLREWRDMLADSGWGCPTWPVGLYGRGLTPGVAAVVTEEFRRVAAVGPATGIAMTLVAPTVLAHGSDEVKARLLRPILTGEHKWCQLFSEPGSGSDLAGLTTRAERDGDEWIVNGQKVWNSGAHQAAYGMLLARTDWEVPKHRGISFFALPMGQPGVDVRPLRQMNGHATFNEVFFSDARVADADRIGGLGEGWRVALTTLAHERGAVAGRRPKSGKEAELGRTAREAEAEAAAYYKTYEWYPQRAGRADLVPVQIRANGLGDDPVVRQVAAGLRAVEQTSRWSAKRAQAARAQGRPPGPEGSLAKLFTSNIARTAANAHTDVVGAHGMLSGPDSPQGGLVAEVLVSVPGQSIAGGTDEIQHNIIGERVLDLPKEPQVDNELPFRQVRTNTGRG